ncbi:MAG: hypothetical protein ACK55O_02220 [Phycisphaerales bacterium]
MISEWLNKLRGRDKPGARFVRLPSAGEQLERTRAEGLSKLAQAAGGSAGSGGAGRGFRLRARRSMNDRLWSLIYAVGDFFARPRVKRASIPLIVALLIGGSVAAYFMLRPRAVPDVAFDDIGDVMDFTLLTADFNDLELDDRLALIRELIKRLKTMDSGDSAMLAAFAAGITGKAREQLQKNAEKLFIDLWDREAGKYEEIPQADRGAYLDNAFIEMVKLAEDISGFSSPRSPVETLAEAKREAPRQEQFARRNDRGLQGPGASFIFETVQRGSQIAAPQQRARMARFSRDMTRHIRGRDLDSGKPKDPFAPGGDKPALPPVPEQTDPNAPAVDLAAIRAAAETASERDRAADAAVDARLEPDGTLVVQILTLTQRTSGADLARRTAEHDAIRRDVLNEVLPLAPQRVIRVDIGLAVAPG